MLDLAASLWLGALLVSAALLGLVVLVQTTVRSLRALRHSLVVTSEDRAAQADRRLAA